MIVCPLARWNPAISAVASPNRFVRVITTTSSPFPSRRCRLETMSGFGPSRTKMNSYGTPSVSSPARYSAYSAVTSGAWRRPIGTITDSAIGDSLGIAPAGPLASLMG